MSRLPNVQPEDFSNAQQQLFESITGGKRAANRTLESFLNHDGGLRGPFNALLYSPTVGNAAQRLGETLRFEGDLPPTLRELAILTVAAKWQAQYEWWAHEKVGLSIGLDPSTIQGIKESQLPVSVSEPEALVYNFASELMVNHHVTDERYAEAISLLGESAMVELVVLVGYYTMISMMLNTFNVPLPQGETLPFQR